MQTGNGSYHFFLLLPWSALRTTRPSTWSRNTGPTRTRHKDAKLLKNDDRYQCTSWESTWHCCKSPFLNSKTYISSKCPCSISILDYSRVVGRWSILMWVKFCIDDGWNVNTTRNLKSTIYILHTCVSQWDQTSSIPVLWVGTFCWFARNDSRWWNIWRSLPP